MNDADEMFEQLRDELGTDDPVADDLADAELGADGVADEDDVWPFHLLDGKEFRGPFAAYDEGGRPLLNVYASKRAKGPSGHLRWVPDSAELSEFCHHATTRRELLEQLGPGRYALRLLDWRGRVVTNGAVTVGDLRRNRARPTQPKTPPGGDERVAWLQEQLGQVQAQAKADTERAQRLATAAVQRVHEEYKSRLRRLGDELDDSQAQKRKLREALEAAEKKAGDLEAKLRQVEFEKLKLEMQANGGGAADPVEAMRAFNAQRQRFEAAAAEVGVLQPQAPQRSVGDAMSQKVEQVMNMGKTAAKVGLFAAMDRGN